MNLVIDWGNTRIKVATFSNGRIETKFIFQSSQDVMHYLKGKDFECAIVSTVSNPADEILLTIAARKKFTLSHTLPLPIRLKYETPTTLGVDRIAAVCGAESLFPANDCLVIDAGTCVTYDFIDRQGNYLGGAISPGIAMRFEAMHTFTKRLPLVTPAAEQLIGKTTQGSMRSGVMNGILHEVDGFVNAYKGKYPDLRVVLCGGDTAFFENNLKQPIFAAPDLVLIGLNRILNHNAAL
ncbi:MAG TPA: type III pantothenate kinase [Cyclobacteriaceae bacterium]|nr:type III pantothenate kinase [Cyclobacteriaceae bacterium]